MADPSQPQAAFVDWGRRGLIGVFDAEQTAKRVGHYKWVEMKLFELLGGWAALTPERDVRFKLGEHCAHHAFHAELWHKQLVQLEESNSEKLVVPAGPEVEALFVAIGDPVDPSSTVEKLVGLYRVLIPHLIAAYTFHLNTTSQIADAPTIRSLKFCLQDDQEEWREGEMILQSIVETGEQVERANHHQAELTKLLVAAGGVVGRGSISPTQEQLASQPTDSVVHAASSEDE